MHNRGYTLTELLTALSIAGLLVAASAPLNSLIKQLRLTNCAHEFTAALRFARSRAILDQTGVTVAARDGSWINGWIIFTDPNRNARLDSGEVKLISQARMQNLRVATNSPVTSYIHYSAQGTSQLINGGFQAGTLSFCSVDRSLPGIKITLNSTGKTRSTETECR